MEPNRRRRHLVDTQFQGQFVAIALMAMVIAVNVAVAAAYFLAPPVLLQALTTAHAMAIGLAELLLVFAAYHFGVRASNRIAGPVYVMARSVERLADGDFSFHVHLRRDDYFKAFGEEVNVSIDRLRARVTEMKQVMEELSSVLPNDGPARELANRLHRELAAIRTDVEADGAGDHAVKAE